MRGLAGDTQVRSGGLGDAMTCAGPRESWSAAAAVAAVAAAAAVAALAAVAAAEVSVPSRSPGLAVSLSSAKSAWQVSHQHSQTASRSALAAAPACPAAFDLGENLVHGDAYLAHQQGFGECRVLEFQIGDRQAQPAECLVAVLACLSLSCSRCQQRVV